MSELVGRVLKDLYEQQGVPLLQDPRELQQVLLDLCPDEEPAIRLILLGLSRQLPRHLLATEHGGLGTQLQRLAADLQQEYQLSARFSQWVVESWGAALGILPLALEPHHIFAEAEEEYRHALRAALTGGELTQVLRSELTRLQVELLIEPDNAERIQTEVQQELRRKQQAQTYQAAPSQWSKPLENSLGMQFMRVEPGTFAMGSPDYERHREQDETLHEVSLSQAYYLQRTPVTQRQWLELMGSNPSDFKGPELPVENISWNDIMTLFLPRLNELGQGVYRLPTEAEWEYAARAGSSQAYYLRDDASQLDSYAWYNNNSQYQTQPVGQKKPNAWGFYDLHGNVWEWCQDWYQGPYGPAAQQDPSGPVRGLGRVMRGGSWFCNASACRSAARGYMLPETRIRLIGFRLVRENDTLLSGKA